MRIIISESQYRQIIENEENSFDYNLYPLDLNDIVGDDIEEILVKGYRRFSKFRTSFDGIMIIGYFDLSYVYNDDVKEILKELVMVVGNFEIFNRRVDLPKLKMVKGSLILENTKMKSLPELEYVDGSLKLHSSTIESLPKLKKVGVELDLRNTKIAELPSLEFVGGDLHTGESPLAKLNFRDIRSKIKILGGISK
jgi:hypothetical protein